MHESANCSVNEISVDELFSFYEESGFLYDAKKRRLKRHFSEVNSTWQKSIQTQDIHRVFWSTVTAANGNETNATLSTWRTTFGGWHTQHMVSSGRGVTALSNVCQAMVNSVIKDPDAHSIQFWFRSENRFANRILRDWGNEFGWVGDFAIMEMSGSALDSISDAENVSHMIGQKVTDEDLADIRSFVIENYSEEFATANEIDNADKELQSLNTLYSNLGLSRSRETFVVRSESDNSIEGILVFNWGPIGLSFSFLENRIDILTPQDIDLEKGDRIVMALLRLAKDSYGGSPLETIPVVLRPCLRSAAEDAGATFLRNYSQTIICYENLLPGIEFLAEQFAGSPEPNDK